MSSITNSVSDTSQSSVASSNQATQEQTPETEDSKQDEEFLQFLSTSPEMKQNVKHLLKVSEFFSNLDTYHPSPHEYDFIDVICGWEATVPSPTYAVSAAPTNVAKKRRSKTMVDYDRRASRVEDCPCTEYVRHDMVEQDTYRYIPGNGNYRLAKQRGRLMPPSKLETNYTFMPKRPSLNTEQRYVQRMANRELRAAFLDRKTDEVADYDEDELSPRNLDRTEREKDVKNGYSPSQVRTGTKDFRRRKKDKMSGPAEEKTHDASVLSKAFTDRIMQNFTNKISAIEDQIRGEANWWAMAAGGATYLQEKQSEKRNSLPLDSIQVVSVNKANLPLRPLQKIPQQGPLAPKVFGSQTGPQNTPRYNYLDSYILNPLNLEAARPKQSMNRAKDQNDVKQSELKTTSGDAHRKRKSRDERVDIEDTSGFQSSPVGKPNPRDKKVDMVNEPDIITPSVTLPELFGKKLQVAVTTQKFL